MLKHGQKVVLYGEVLSLSPGGDIAEIGFTGSHPNAAKFAVPGIPSDVVKDLAQDTAIIASDAARANKRQVGGNHYSEAGGIQPWDFFHTNHMEWLPAETIKYISRFDKKNGLQDLEKAKHCLEKLIEVVKERNDRKIEMQGVAPEQAA